MRKTSGRQRKNRKSDCKRRKRGRLNYKIPLLILDGNLSLINIITAMDQTINHLMTKH
jgi:hypothetical protein